MTEPTSPLRKALAPVKRALVWAALRALPDELSVKVQYWRAFHRWPDLKNPRRLTEKIQLLKLRGGLEAHWGWVDKIEAKQRVSEVLGPQWITPTLWCGTALPPRKERTWPTPYVIKASHGSGWIHHVVSDADKDWPAIEKACASWLRQSWHPHLRERQYEAIAPRLLVEERLGGTAEVIPYDYKFRVYNGRVRDIGVSIDRLQTLKIAMMDRDWNLLPFTMDKAPPVEETPPRPPHLADMIVAAEKLAAPFPFARIDFYDLPAGPRFGEITLTPSSGHTPFNPDEWDFITGGWLDIAALTPRR